MQNQTLEEFKLDILAAYKHVCEQEKEREKRLTERRRAAEDRRIAKELEGLTEL